MLSPDRESLDFQCNCCGRFQNAPLAAMQRDAPSCLDCGSSVRLRAVVHHLGMLLYQQPTALPSFQGRKALHGLGFGDWPGYAEAFARLFDYQSVSPDDPTAFDLGAPLQPERREAFDFVICAEVLHRVAASPERALTTIAGLLRRGGFALLTVPYADNGRTVERYPGFVTGKTVEVDGSFAMVYRHTDGSLRLASADPRAADGAAVAMRDVALGDLLAELDRAGLTGVRVLDGDYRPFGVVNQQSTGLPILAWKE